VGGVAPPLVSLFVVLRNSLTLVIHVAQGVLSFRIALIGCFVVPDGGLHVVLRHSLAPFIPEANTVLGLRISLVGCFAVPAGSLGVILRHSLTLVIEACKIVLGVGVSLLGSHAACLCIRSEFPLGGSRFDKMPSKCSPTDQGHTTNGYCNPPT